MEVAHDRVDKYFRFSLNAPAGDENRNEAYDEISEIKFCAYTFAVQI